MSYCEQDDIVPAKLSEEKISQLTSEEPGIIGDDVIDEAIIAADGEIDSYCGKRYTIPFDPIPDRIRTLSANITVYKIYERRINELGGEVPKSVRDMYTDAISFLKDVSSGKANIDGAVKPTVNTKTTGGSFHSNDRVFSKDSMRNL